MEASSDYSDSDDYLDKYREIVKLLEEHRELKKKNKERNMKIKELDAIIKEKNQEISKLESTLANYAEGKEEEEEEEIEVEHPLYQLSAVVAYTMDRAYYNKCHNDAKAILDDEIWRKFSVFKYGKPPIYISIENKTLKFGRYEIATTLKKQAAIMKNFKKSVKLANKQSFYIFKAYAEELQKDDYDEKKLEIFNHMFED